MHPYIDFVLYPVNFVCYEALLLICRLNHQFHRSTAATVAVSCSRCHKQKPTRRWKLAKHNAALLLVIIDLSAKLLVDSVGKNTLFLHYILSLTYPKL